MAVQYSAAAAAAALIEAQGGGASGLRLTEREGGVEVKSLERVRTCWVSRQGAGDGPAQACAYACKAAACLAAVSVLDEAACPCGPAMSAGPTAVPMGCWKDMSGHSFCE